MPQYSFECVNGHVWDEFLTFAQYNDEVKCKCGEIGKRKFVPTKNLIWVMPRSVDG